MNAGLIKLLSMDKYERLLTRLFPGSSTIEIRDELGRSIWRSESSGTQPEADSEEWMADKAWSEAEQGLQSRRVSSGERQYRIAFESQALQTVAWLVVAYHAPRAQTPAVATAASLHPVLVDAAALLRDEVELHAECNQLAAELTERYEELNLVYATNDQVERAEEGQAALQQLVHNCVDYLNVGLSVLICRERKLSLHSVNGDRAEKDVDQLLDLIGGAIYDRVESQLDYLVINEADDPERGLLLEHHSDSLLAQPVFDNHGTAIGVLAVLGKENGEIFSNGDKNLLAVMAKKVSRVIHTHHDSLTGLMNRSGFEAALVAALIAVKKQGRRYCVLHVDIDQLHVVNDLMGHHEGDALIRRVARTLQSCVRESDQIGRLGGDEFSIILSDCSIEQARAVAKKISTAIGSLKVMSTNRQLEVSASIGVADVDAKSEGMVGLMATAELACKAAKEAGRNEIRVFEDDNVVLARRSAEVEWISRIQGALQNDEFELFCQPVLPLKNPKAAPHFEILIRMRKDGEILSPAEFLPAAERYQLMPQIDRWVVRNTLKALDSAWSAISPAGPVFCLNLSGQSLTNSGFQTFVLEELERTLVPSRNICFEITETCAISNIDEATGFMNQIQATGARFSLDDFGAGLSSFGYLRMLPVDYLKVDGSFIRNIVADNVSRAMVEAICQIAVTMGLHTVAEFVGDEETVRLLDGIGVDYVQGYHVGKPAPLVEIVRGLYAADEAVSA